MKKVKKGLSIILAVIMMFSAVPLTTIKVEANSNVTLESLQKKYPHGKYWNGGNANSYTSTPCTHHGSCSYSGACGCNTFKGHAIQCMGFSYQLAYLIYGGDPYADWTVNRNVSALNSLKAGDVVRYKNDGHSIFVTTVNGDTVTYADCNSDGHCKIRWGQTVSKSTLKSTFTYVDSAPYEWKNSMKESTKYATPIKAYTLATGKTIVYSSVGGSAKSNKIYDTDICTINTIYENGWCKVTFPLDAGGTETGYVKTAVFFNPNYNIFKVTAGKGLTTYTRSDLSKSLGKVGSGDTIYVLGHTSTAVQIFYSLTSGGYQVGWVPISVFTYTIAYNANSGSGTMASTTAKYSGTMALSANKFTKTGYTFTGWNVYRSSDKTWYVKGIGWQTASQISANSYTKSVYKDGLSCVFNKSWLKGSKTNDTLTFYPVWEANTLSVYYNANGGTMDSDTYKLSSNVVYNQSDSSKYIQKWTYNQKKTNGLVNANTFGLSKTGYSFVGWGTTTSGGTIFNQSDADLVPTSINSNIKTDSCSRTLYAIWKPNTYAVKYNANGGTGAPSAQTKTYGTTLTLSNAVPSRNGYVFKGWATSSTATVAQYQPRASYTSNKAITLYAVWELDASQSTHTHEWNTSYTIDLEPTCTEEGIKSLHCKTCDESTKITIIPVINHTLEEVITREASCAQKGQKEMVCAVCGTVTEQIEIPAEAHDFMSTVITEATCTQEGVKADVCCVCQLQTNVEVISVDEHEFGEWKVIVEASVKGDGTENRECVKCKHTETRTIHYVPVYDEESPMVKVQDSYVKAGEEVKISLELMNNPGICALNVALIYDADYFTLTSIENKVSTMVMTSDTAIVWDATENYMFDGQLAELTFEVSEHAPHGKYEIQIIFMGASNSNFEEVTMLGVSGTISVDSVVYGDANGDKQVTTVDLAMIRKYLASKDPITGESSIAVQGGADCNGDASVGTVDLAMIRKYLASKDPITGESTVVLGPQS